jgi:protein-tyrosine phosphatase
MKSQVSVLFVCMGNICRSPTAHGIMQALVDERGLQERVKVESAGTHAYHVGEKSDSRSRQMAAQKGIDMEFIRAQKISICDYDEYDFILAMDEDNLDLVNYYAPEDFSARIALFLSFANSAGKTDQIVVPDPYYGGGDGFAQVFDLVNVGCEALLEEMLSEQS